MRFLIIFIFLFSNSLANEVPNIKNIVINKEFKTYDNIAFLDVNEKMIRLKDYKGSVVLLNFWATWCAPCKEEMPSLDALKINPNFDNLEILPINIGKDSLYKSEKFFIKKDNFTNTFMFIGRIIIDKGIRELIEAIKIVKNYDKNINFIFLGKFDKNNPKSMNEFVFNKFITDYGITHYKFTDNIDNFNSLEL